MASAKNITFAGLKSEIKSRKFNSVYLLHGEESYFIDEAVKLFEKVIPEEESDFNMYSLYATQTLPEEIVATCRRYPIMADLQMVILREVQAAPKRELAKLAPYLENPNPHNVLVMVSRGAKMDSKPVLDALRKGGATILESKKLYDSGIGTFITELVKDSGMSIDAKGVDMLVDNIGADLAKLNNEIEKLNMILGKGACITPEAIELHVGISKEYNNTELIDSIARRDFVKSCRIVDYFRRNPKANPTVVTGASLFSFFSNLLIAQFTKDKSDQSLMKALGLRWPMQLRQYKSAMNNFNAWQSLEIISLIRDFDCKVKGNGSRQPEYSLLEELVYAIFFAKGQLNY